MRMDQVRRLQATPIGAPAYSPGPYRFCDREYLNVVYRTDPEALRAVVPEPLAVGEPLVKFEVMKMPNVTGLGSFAESGQVLRVEYEGQPADYLHAISSTASPRSPAGARSAPPQEVWCAVALRGLRYPRRHPGLRHAACGAATMGFKHAALAKEAALAEITAPTYALKIVPGYDRRPRVLELVRSEITDITVKEAWTGPARLQLFEHALAPMADLPVREVVAASHIRVDLTLAPFAPVFDYLAEAPEARA